MAGPRRFKQLGGQNSSEHNIHKFYEQTVFLKTLQNQALKWCLIKDIYNGKDYLYDYNFFSL